MSKKILIIPSWYPTEKNFIQGSFFQEQASLLSNNGFDVKILYGIVSFTTRINYIKNWFKKIIKPNTNILKNDYLIQRPEALSFSIYHLKKWKEELKIKVIKNSYNTAFSELLESGWKPDLIHAQCTVNGGIISNHLSNNFKIPYVIIEHQFFMLNYYSKFKQGLIVNSINNAKRIGAVSNHQKRCILMNLIDCNPLVIWNFVDEDKFKIENKRTVHKFRILTITYPSFIKDVETFFKSIETFSKLTNDDFEVIIIGNNSIDNLSSANTVTFENLAKKYNVYSKCVLIPYLPRNEISEILNTANVFISTSIAETFGVSVREAMLCGIPIIATKSGGVEDSINERTGITVDIKDYEAIAEALLKIKDEKIIFNPHYIRNFIINQCGRASFLKKMDLFYS